MKEKVSPKFVSEKGEQKLELPTVSYVDLDESKKSTVEKVENLP